MPAKVNVDLAEVQARLQQIKADGGDVSAALGAFGGVVLNRIRLGFRMGRTPWGAAWLPVKLRVGQPLRNTGQLQRSITMQTGKDAVTIGTNHPGRNVHQFGATIRPRNVSLLRFPGPNGFIFAKEVTVPARPFMPINQSNQVDLPQQWAQSGLEAMKKALKL